MQDLRECMQVVIKYCNFETHCYVYVTREVVCGNHQIVASYFSIISERKIRCSGKNCNIFLRVLKFM
jgi:hypothetical protein